MHVYALVLASFLASTGAGIAQNERRATMIEGGDSGQSRCTIEVEVDGIAEIGISGDQGSIRTISGRPAEWRRFLCTEPLPAKPADFHFERIEGRGRQALVQDPAKSGLATVRIEDPLSGSASYTFDLVWTGNRAFDTGGVYSNEGGTAEYRDRISLAGSGEAMKACEDGVRHEAARRFKTDPNSLDIYDVRLDNNSGRRDWVLGRVDLPRGSGIQNRYEFACSVNFNTGLARSIRIDPISMDRNGGAIGVSNQDPARSFDRARAACQSDVAERLRRGGYAGLDFGSVRVSNTGSSRENSITGVARASGSGRYDIFDFTCTLDDFDEIRSVDVWQR